MRQEDYNEIMRLPGEKKVWFPTGCSVLNADITTVEMASPLAWSVNPRRLPQSKETSHESAPLAIPEPTQKIALPTPMEG